MTELSAPGAPLTVAAVWKILVVDDEPAIHQVTKLALRNIEVLGRPLQLINALSGRDALQEFARHPDIAVVLLDVVMETDSAGLDVVRHVREVMGNLSVRIILRTGQPGQVPERKVLVDYDINDYKEKTELTANKLFTAITTNVRTYRDICALQDTRLLLRQLSHELQTPLGVGVMAASLLDTSNMNAEQRESVELLGASVHRSIELLTAYRQRINPVSNASAQAMLVQVNIHEAARLPLARFPSLKVALTLDVASDLQWLCDGTAFRQIIANLVTNSLLHGLKGRESGSIRIQATANSLDYQDDGAGLSTEVRARLFEHGFSTGQGQGLGMGIVQGLVQKQLHGTLHVLDPPKGVHFKIDINPAHLPESPTSP